MGKMRYTKKIDGQKLKSEILRKCRSYGEADRIMGFSSAIGNWINRNTIPEYATYIIEAKLDIPFDSYAEKEPEEQSTQEAKKKPCHYCKDETNFIIDFTSDNINAFVSILPSRKIMECTMNYKSESIGSDNCFINYCPVCGRKF